MVPDSMDIEVMVCEVHTVPDDEDDDINEEDVEVTYTPGLGTMMAAKREPPVSAQSCPERSHHNRSDRGDLWTV